MVKKIFTPKYIAIVLSIGTAALIITSFFNEAEKRRLNQRYEQQIEQHKKVLNELQNAVKDSQEILDSLNGRLGLQENSK
ncbi:hypothetical protein BRE01_26890 [Brevibacillus reuszeri]|uniref:Uncharacterized protein n=1 Tax=Brevibacillus reuszeri TaxID=54915 RepID=A0A0K9YM03_9BACL|nr:hypothetical protein [Brevibacillus reuszeri]KNB69682.1 hypothetical protein ADS79_27935 [Brevibacillus reuszeri]MED1858022.1 hypothetical protein [Brevibacillus reuszeri]GED68987.1 hypothetical protein BRE01_26890 [Brevibacillus reuszeri]